MIAFFTVRTLKLVTASGPVFSSTYSAQTEMIDLWELGFMFAIEDIDPKIGRIEAELFTWEKDTSD